MNKTRFYVVRHGQSEGNVNPKESENDPQLTYLGIEQAKRRAQEFKNIHLDGAYSSHLKRAVQTSKIIIGDRSIPHTTYEDLREREYGKFFLNTEFQRIVDDIVNETGKINTEEWWHYQHPEAIDIEPYKICFSRFYLRLNAIAEEHTGETILLVSHGDLMRSLLVFSGYGDHLQVGWEAVQNTGYIILDIEKNKKPEIISTVDIIKL